MRVDGWTHGNDEAIRRVSKFTKIRNKTTEGLLDWSILAYELPAKTRSRRKETCAKKRKKS